MAIVTHGVNSRRQGFLLKSRALRSKTSTVLRTLGILGTCAALAVVAGCEKSSAGNADNYANIGKTFDDPTPPEQRKPVEGIDLSEMSEADKTRFNTLVDKLASPCGKPHSLRTSRNTDAECIQAPFAASYVAELIKDGAPDKQIVEFYQDRYKDHEKRAFKLGAEVPRKGPDDAPVVLVEFFDYGCGHCKDFAPELAEAVGAFPTDAVLYYKQFPLSSHPDSGPAAQAAIAAARQGKFDEMHKLLFLNAPRHKPDDLKGYAKSLGLDMQRFEADYAAAAPQVTADKNEGIAAGVTSTPTLYINGITYTGPPIEKYVVSFVREALALSR